MAKKGPTPIERVQWESCPCDNSLLPHGMFTLCPFCGFLFTEAPLSGPLDAVLPYTIEITPSS